MRKAAKEPVKNGAGKEEAEPESELDALKRALKDARGEVMRAQADLERSRMELQEHKRRSAQQALVASEGLREARRERDDLRAQLEALRYSAENGKRKKRDTQEPEEDDRAQKLEEELAELESELKQAQKKAAEEAASLQSALAQSQAAQAELQAALEKARNDLEAARASVPPPPAAVAVAAEQAGEPGFFGKLFGRRR